MSSSNLAVRMEHTVADLLSDPPRPSSRLVASNVRSGRTARPRISLTNRKFVSRDHGLRHFRIR